MLYAKKILPLLLEALKQPTCSVFHCKNQLGSQGNFSVDYCSCPNIESKNVQVNEALAGNVFLNNTVNSQGYPQSEYLNFYLNWPENTDATQYQTSYQYIDFEEQQQTVHSYIAATESHLDIVLPQYASNGLINFYLTKYSNNQPT